MLDIKNYFRFVFFLKEYSVDILVNLTKNLFLLSLEAMITIIINFIISSLSEILERQNTKQDWNEGKVLSTMCFINVRLI